MMAHVLRDEQYRVVALDGDASNPGGLARLMFGVAEGPKPLIDFFGGRAKVECPVDNPTSLTRVGDGIPITEKKMDLAEIPAEYILEQDGIVLLQVGKIEKSCEGCHGPMSKVTRDFILQGEQVLIIDVEAGIEHFGRGVEQHVDLVLVVADPTFESLLIAEKVTRLCREMGKKGVWTIVNKIQSEEMRLFMLDQLKKRDAVPLGVVRYDAETAKRALMGIGVGEGHALDDIKIILTGLAEAM